MRDWRGELSPVGLALGCVVSEGTGKGKVVGSMASGWMSGWMRLGAPGSGVEEEGLWCGLGAVGLEGEGHGGTLPTARCR